MLSTDYFIWPIIVFTRSVPTFPFLRHCRLADHQSKLASTCAGHNWTPRCLLELLHCESSESEGPQDLGPSLWTKTFKIFTYNGWKFFNHLYHYMLHLSLIDKEICLQWNFWCCVLCTSTRHLIYIVLVHPAEIGYQLIRCELSCDGLVSSLGQGSRWPLSVNVLKHHGNWG